MKLCTECQTLVGQQLIRTGRHGGLNSYYERQYVGADPDVSRTVYQYFQCEECSAVLGRQKAPPTPDAVWQLIAEPVSESGEHEDEAANECAFVLTHSGGSIVAH